MFLILTIGILVSISVYLLLQNQLFKRLFGFMLFATVINIIILICGHSYSINPAIVTKQIAHYANPLPQALILTAIVIGFGILAYLCALLQELVKDE